MARIEKLLELNTNIAFKNISLSKNKELSILGYDLESNEITGPPYWFFYTFCFLGIAQLVIGLILTLIGAGVVTMH